MFSALGRFMPLSEIWWGLTSQRCQEMRKTLQLSSLSSIDLRGKTKMLLTAFLRSNNSQRLNPTSGVPFWSIPIPFAILFLWEVSYLNICVKPLVATTIGLGGWYVSAPTQKNHSQFPRSRQFPASVAEVIGCMPLRGKRWALKNDYNNDPWIPDMICSMWQGVTGGSLLRRAKHKSWGIPEK